VGYLPYPKNIYLRIITKWWYYKCFVGLETETHTPRDPSAYEIFRELIKNVTPITEAELKSGYQNWAQGRK
jgi:hypothetical protein